MSILQVCSETDPGAFVNVAARRDPRTGRVIGYGPAEAGPNRILREAYVGRVLALGERNGYDDSDFTALVYDDEKDAVEEIVYASTRGWTYDLYGASVDAPAELVSKIEERKKQSDRRRRILNRRAVSKRRAELARTFGVRLSDIRRLETALGLILNDKPVSANPYLIGFGLARAPTVFDRVLQLITSYVNGRLRSAFKKNLAEQVLAWLRDPAPQYPTPLSKRQLEYV